jgi:hypothetical protein
MFMCSADSGVDGLAVLPDVSGKKSGPKQVAEDAMDCLRCGADSWGEPSISRKLDIAEGHVEDVGNEHKSSSPSSIFGVACSVAAIRAVPAIRHMLQTSYRANEFLHHFCQFLAMWTLMKNILL